MKPSFLLLEGLCGLFLPAFVAEAAKPNIVLIVADDLGYADVTAEKAGARRTVNPFLPWAMMTRIDTG